MFDKSNDCYKFVSPRVRHQTFYNYSIPAGKILCSSYSTVVAANTSIQVDYYYNTMYDSEPSHYDNPFAILETDNQQYYQLAKIYAKNSSEPFFIQLVLITTSLKESTHIFYSMFNTHLYLCKKFVSHQIVVPEKKINFTTRMNIVTFNGRGSSAPTTIMDWARGSQISENVIRKEYASLIYEQKINEVESIFDKEKLYMMPYKRGVYTKAEVEEFTKLNEPIFNITEFDPYDLSEDTKECIVNEIWNPKFANRDSGLKYTDSKVFTIKPGDCQCLYGNFVLDSKDDFIATIEYNDTMHYSAYDLHVRPNRIIKKYENPFSLTTEKPDERLSNLIKLECKSKTESCKIQAIGVLPPLQKRFFLTPMILESIFTTNISFSIEKEIIINQEEIQMFSITIHNKKKFNVKVSSNNDKINNYFAASDSNSSNETSFNTITIYPSYDMHKFILEEENFSNFQLTAKVKVEVSPVAESSEENTDQQDEIFEENLFLRLPTTGGGTTKQDVIEYNKKEEELERGHGKLILLISIAITTVLAIAIIIYVVIVAYREKKKNKDKEEMKEVVVTDDENEKENQENKDEQSGKSNNSSEESKEKKEKSDDASYSSKSSKEKSKESKDDKEGNEEEDKSEDMSKENKDDKEGKLDDKSKENDNSDHYSYSYSTKNRNQADDMSDDETGNYSYESSKASSKSSKGRRQRNEEKMKNDVSDSNSEEKSYSYSYSKSYSKSNSNSVSYTSIF
ncbi:hypothetical protein TVAG_305980 [Trichomonas vaginalis G3]|uniref:Uncharacterized protein n=1 Tax=Trichomonas vaginalis (strain ATCC PRA-98 / G3) TaxID=412133 RepID=A2DN90_TRIV3|nr:glycoprotein 38 family [Trichomonas vaginalis G3]EAY18078.1 hypothetical protein TVAG_305980 [Trichomonas vaginalis G3]KAI5492353.1 glycoprotein 38 family [Trichomonas vaginalis G3]|eukprot:XP_001579064.1 hypothetical protein [Trichomonas vaginalis G3]